MYKKVVNYSNKIILITGASSGIGRATALAFSKKKATLALSGRNKLALSDLKLQIENEGGQAQIFPFDLNETTKIPLLIAKVEKVLGSNIDILINNAGIGITGLIEDIPPEEFVYILNVNFIAPVALIQAVIPKMKNNKSGLIINISSGAAKRGLPLLSAYCASKAALYVLTESLRVELAPHQINIMSFSPGLVETPFTEHSKKFGVESTQFSSGKMVTPESVGELIVEASEKLKREVSLTKNSKLIGIMNSICPQIIDYIFVRMMSKSQLDITINNK